MVPAADEDPLVAVVRHASPAEIETVIIAGEIRKMDGVLFPATVKTNCLTGLAPIEEVAPDGVLPWSMISAELRRSRRAVQNRARGCNMEAAKRGVLGVLGLSKGQLDDVFD